VGLRLSVAEAAYGEKPPNKRSHLTPLCFAAQVKRQPLGA